MELQEYKDKLKQLEAEFQKNKNQLAKDFALSNSPYKVGDIFTDHIGSVKIESVRVSISSYAIPECVYYGEEISKSGKPFKRETKRSAWQSNDVNKK